MERLLEEREIVEYENYLRGEERAEATISKYIRDVRSLYRFLYDTAENQLLLISREKVIHYKEFLKKKYRMSSTNSMLAAINNFFSFLGCPEYRVKLLRIQKQLFCEEEKELTKEEYYRLVRTARKNGKERLSLILQTLCGLGLRISELKFVTWDAVKKGKLQICNKGKNRTVFIDRKLQRELLQFGKRKKVTKEEVFITRNGKSINRSNLWKEMKQLCGEAGVPKEKVYPHNLRHLFARTFYAIQKDVVKLADLMGHSSIETTRIYTVTSGTECRKKIEALKLIL